MNQDQLVPSNATICIIGAVNLQNQFLSYVMSREIGTQCLIHDRKREVLSPEQNMLLEHDHDSLLILIDADYQDYEETLKSFAPDEALRRGSVALFNLNESTGIEKRALSQNIRGFFYKDDQFEVFLKGVRSVFSGEIWVSRKMLLKYVMDSFSDKNIPVEEKTPLTCREVEILNFVCTGSTNEEIANKMCISTNTVKTHLYKIFKKINVENRLQAALWTASNL